MSAHLVFDIETVPNIPLMRQMLELGDDVPAQLVKDTWLKKHPSKAKEDGQPNDWIGPGMLVPLTIGYLKANSALEIESLGVYDAPHYRMTESTAAFWHDVPQASNLVSFNARGFDIPILELQAMGDRLPMPYWFARVGVKQWDQPRYRYVETSCDLYDIYANFGAHHMVGGLDAVAKRIGCPGKMGTSGADVWGMYVKGQIAEIADYCQCDVLDTYWLLVRYELQMGHITLDRERELRLAFVREYAGRTPALTEYCKLLKIPAAQVEPAPIVKPALVLGSLESEL